MGKSINCSSTTLGPFWYTNSFFLKQIYIFLVALMDYSTHLSIEKFIYILLGYVVFKLSICNNDFLHLLILLHWQLTREQKGIYITGWKELISPARLLLIYPYFDIYVCVLIGWNLTTENDTSNLYKCKDLGI